MIFFHLFTDPLYRAPFIGSMLMCFSVSLMGACLFVKRKSLLGETLSHAAYPGIVIATLIGSFFSRPVPPFSTVMILVGAFLFASLGVRVIEKLNKNFRIHFDTALCFVLSISLGLGVVIASRMQFTHPLWYQQSQLFLYGQAATMMDSHIYIYGFVSIAIALFILFRFREIELVLFDETFGESIGLNVNKIFRGIFFLLVISIIVGIRSVGVILMAGMLIAPASAARCLSDRFSHLLVFSGLFGLISGFAGNYLSIQFSGREHGYPTGPMILLFAAFLTLLSLLFAPKRGALVRLIRISRFRKKCRMENILKTLWKGGKDVPLSHQEILKYNKESLFQFQQALWTLKRKGWVSFLSGGKVLLTLDGVQKAERLVRLHRLWEVYLVNCLNLDQERVHHSAEEMEHILTPNLEKRLIELLNDPEKDPHQKPIPRGSFT